MQIQGSELPSVSDGTDGVHCNHGCLLSDTEILEV